MLLFLLAGLLLLRCAERQLFALLFQLPPRITRFEPDGGHPKSLQYVPAIGQAVRRHHEGQQCLHPPLQFRFASLPFNEGPLITPELAREPNLAAAGQAHRVGKQPVTEKVHSQGGAVEARLRFELKF